MDEEDRLKRLRKAGPPSPGQAGGRVSYEPFRIAREPLRHLEFRPRFPAPAECPPYAMISNMRVEWRLGKAVSIVFGGKMAVDVRGRGLLDLVQALKECRVDWIAEFDPEEHLPPLGEASPFVESIEIVVHRPEEMGLPRRLH